MRHHTLLNVVQLAVGDVGAAVLPVEINVAIDRARIDYPLHRSLDVDAIRQVADEVIAADLATSTAPGADGVPAWQVDGWPPIRCGGLHVQRLGEIGPFSLCVTPIGSSGVRVHASCLSAGGTTGLVHRPGAPDLRVT